ncbi:MAG: hypothetical protein IJE46_02400 [Clostridia bacterium]|nr:hypothetical protein [Clostridia bacterium]
MYDLSNLDAELCTFTLDKADVINPHSNAVMFGNEFNSSGDEFPILYTNIYNNYAGAEDKLKGVCLAYRLHKDNNQFSSTLVQMIEIGFVEYIKYWRSSIEDVRPFGNFTIDRKDSKYYAFTMIDESNITRYFSFDLPKLCDGITDVKYNVKKVTLGIQDIKEQFDCEYHHFVQGACFDNDKIYSLEGFTNSINNPPALRIIDTANKKQETYINLPEAGIGIEPEMVDFWDGVCYIGDAEGNLYIAEF